MFALVLMSATALTITFYYGLMIFTGLIFFSFWLITRKDEDKIWRWILSIIGSMVFCTMYWLAYWFATLDMVALVYLTLAGVLGWLWNFFSHSTDSVLDKSVFCAFGAISFGMVMAGAYSAGTRGWWWMAIPFYCLSFYMLYHMFEPD